MPVGSPSVQTRASKKYQEKVGLISKSYKLKKELVERFAEACDKKGKKICNSNLVGYDQNQRNTLHTAFKKYKYNASKYIKSGEKSETDCSAFMTVLAIVAGVVELEYTGNAPTTSTMVDAFVETGKFKKKKYKKGMTLKPGYILVKEGSHTVMYLG